jgi:hypothetical protein
VGTQQLCTRLSVIKRLILLEMLTNYTVVVCLPQSVALALLSSVHIATCNGVGKDITFLLVYPTLSALSASNSTFYSHEHIASTIRVTRIGELGTTLAISSQSASVASHC